MEKLVHSPREFDWRQSILDNFESVRNSHHKLDKEVAEIKALIKHKMLSIKSVNDRVHIEMAPTVQKVSFLEKVVYSLIGAVGTIVTAVITAFAIKWIHA